MSSRRMIGSELKKLPYMLGKVFGGILAVIGFGASVYISTHGAVAPSGNIVPYILTGLTGLAVFIISSMLSSRQAKEEVEEQSSGKGGRVKNSVISWVILFALAAVFIIFVLFMKG